MSKFTRVCVPSLFATLTLGCALSLGQEDCSEDQQCVAVYGAGAVCGDAGYCVVEGDGLPIGDASGEVGVLVNGVSPTTVRTLGVAAQTGTTRDLGIGMTIGIQAAIAAAKPEATNGIRLQHYPKDDGYVPDMAEVIIDEITRDAGSRPDPEPMGGASAIEGREAFAVIGSMGSPTSLRMLPTVNDRQVLFFGTYSGASHLYNDPPDNVVWQYRPRYEDESYELTKWMINERDPNPVPKTNVFAFSQSPVAGNPCDQCGPDGQGTAGEAEAASREGQNVMDAYGFSGYKGIRRALQEEGVSQVDIPLATYRANSTDVDVAIQYFCQWVAGIAEGAHPPEVTGSGPLSIGIVMIPVALPGAEFVEAVVSEVERFKAGEKPVSLTQEEWDSVPQAWKDQVRNMELVITSISPAGDVMAQTLATKDAARLCGSFDIVVSQVVPFPNGNSEPAIAFRNDLAAVFPNEIPGFVTFEGWAVGKIWGEVIRRTSARGAEITTESVVETLATDFQNVDLGIGTIINYASTDHQGSDRIFAAKIDPSCQYQDFTLTAN